MFGIELKQQFQATNLGGPWAFLSSDSDAAFGTSSYSCPSRSPFQFRSLAGQIHQARKSKGTTSVDSWFGPLASLRDSWISVKRGDCLEIFWLECYKKAFVGTKSIWVFRESQNSQLFEEDATHTESGGAGEVLKNLISSWKGCIIGFDQGGER